MRFLVDQDVYALSVEWLRELGHDVVTVKEIGMERAEDEELLINAKENSRIFVTLNDLLCQDIIWKIGACNPQKNHHVLRRAF